MHVDRVQVAPGPAERARVPRFPNRRSPRYRISTASRHWRTAHAQSARTRARFVNSIISPRRRRLRSHRRSGRAGLRQRRSWSPPRRDLHVRHRHLDLHFMLGIGDLAAGQALLECIECGPRDAERARGERQREHRHSRRFVEPALVQIAFPASGRRSGRAATEIDAPAQTRPWQRRCSFRCRAAR